jgi:myosin heavy subunit
LRHGRLKQAVERVPQAEETQFAMHHYAGTVENEVMDFLEKHKDAQHLDLLAMMYGCHDPCP